MRLEQNNSGGFTAQTWDVGGNEANFFVRDVTGGSRLPFRIRPGAPTSSIDISASGIVGVGTANPSHALHVSRVDGQASIFVNEGSATEASRDMVTLSNNGAPAIRLANTADTSAYLISGPATGAGINVYDANTPASTKVAFGSSSAPQYTVDVTGDLRVYREPHCEHRQRDRTQGRHHRCRSILGKPQHGHRDLHHSFSRQQLRGDAHAGLIES